MEDWKKDVYQKKENHAMEEWNGTATKEGLGEVYRRQTDRERRENRRLKNNTILEMELVEFTVMEVTDKINQMKTKKAAGPDGVKAELLQEIAKEKKLMRIFTKAINEYEVKRKPYIMDSLKHQNDKKKYQNQTI